MAKTKHSSPMLSVQITPEQHERAIQSASGGCLIADAIKTQYPHLTKPTVDMATIRVTDRKEGVRYTYLTPPAAQHLLLSFDQGWPQPVEQIVLKRAVKITPVTRAKSDIAATQARREARKAELEQKIEAGEKLTPHEARAYRQISNPRPAPERPEARGASNVKVDENRGTVVYGGNPTVLGEPHPNLLRGRDRHFGAKLADPGNAFREAVESAVAERLSKEGTAS